MEVSRPPKRGDLALDRPMGLWVLGWLLPMVALFQGLVVLAVSPGGPDGMLRLAVEADPHSLDPGQVFSNEEAMLTTGSAGIVRRPDPKRPTKSPGNVPIGAGPFVVKNWVRGARIQLERNPYYILRKMPQPDRIDVMVNLDRTTQFMMFERGELDFQHYIQDPDFVRIRRRPQLSSALRVVAGSSPTFVFLNCEMPPFTNRLVRLALNYAIDKEALVRVLANRCVVARGPLQLVVRGFNQGLTAYPHDPAKARALLAQAGLTNGFESTLWTNRDDPRWIKIALFVQQSLKEYGIRLEIREVGYPTLVQLCGKRRNVPMGVFDWVSAADDPKELLDSLLNGDNILDENCVNVAFYSNPRAQQLFRDAVAEANSNRRLEIYRQIESIVVEDVSWIFLVQFNTEVLVQHWVKGFKPRGFWPPARFDSTWLEPAGRPATP